MSRRIVESKCLNCGRVNDAVSMTARNKRVPKPVKDDFTVCLYCSHIMVFNADLTLRNLTEDEQRHVLDQPHIMETVEFCREFRKLHPS